MSQWGVESFRVLTTLAAYRVMALDTAGSHQAGCAVKYPAAATDRICGISKSTVKDTTAAIEVAVGGIAPLTFNDTASAGALVTGDANGLGVAHADTTAGSFVVGRVLQTVSATGTIAQVLVQPGFKSIP